MASPAETTAYPLERLPNNERLVRGYFERHYPTIAISEPGFTVMGDTLDFVERTHGDPTLETFLTYHNQNHSIGVFKRGLWVRNLMRTKTTRTVTDTGFEIGAIMDCGHDIIQAAFRKDKETLELAFDDYTICIDNDPEKSDEQLSAEAIVAIMRHQNHVLGYDHFPLEQQSWAYRGIRATEYKRLGDSLSLSEIAKTANDPVILGLIVADTSAIFFGGEHTMIRDASEYAVEKLGGNINDPRQVAEAVTDMMKIQRDFLMARAAEYATLFHQMSDDDTVFTTIKDNTQSTFTHAIAVATFVGSHAKKFEQFLTRELARTKDSIIAPYERIGMAVMKSYALIEAEDELPKDAI